MESELKEFFKNKHTYDLWHNSVFMLLYGKICGSGLCRTGSKEETEEILQLVSVRLCSALKKESFTVKNAIAFSIAAADYAYLDHIRKVARERAQQKKYVAELALPEEPRAISPESAAIGILEEFAPFLSVTENKFVAYVLANDLDVSDVHGDRKQVLEHLGMSDDTYRVFLFRLHQKAEEYRDKVGLTRRTAGSTHGYAEDSVIHLLAWSMRLDMKTFYCG